jgi:hypothetical protein
MKRSCVIEGCDKPIHGRGWCLDIATVDPEPTVSD